MENFKILIVDDEPDIIEFIQYNLTKEGYRVFSAKNGKEALQKAKEVVPDLVLLDIMMPEIDGIEVAKELRESPELHQIIIAFLTARNEDFTQIAAFEAGGDDYITKPIRPRVLVSRIKALLRRKNAEVVSNNRAQFGELAIDKEKYLVYRGGTPLQLTKKEFGLLSLLSSKPGRVFTRDEIFHHIWGTDLIVGDRTIDVHIRKLREKIGEDFIYTVKGVGYKFNF